MLMAMYALRCYTINKDRMIFWTQGLKSSWIAIGLNIFESGSNCRFRSMVLESYTYSTAQRWQKCCMLQENI